MTGLGGYEIGGRDAAIGGAGSSWAASKVEEEEEVEVQGQFVGGACGGLDRRSRRSRDVEGR